MGSSNGRIVFSISVLMSGLTAVSMPATCQALTQNTITIASLAAAQETQTPSTAAQNEIQAPVRYSSEAVLLVVLVLALLGLLFWLLLSWSRRREMAGYYGNLYRDMVENWEYSRLLAPYTEKWENGEYHRESELEKPRPEPSSELVSLAEKLGLHYTLELGGGTPPPGVSRRPGSGLGGLGTSLPSGGGGSDAEEVTDNDAKEFNARRREYFNSKIAPWRSDVERRALEKYKTIQAQERTKAKKRAKHFAGEVDLSVLRGRGAEFVLEFTAVVVIIFAAVILGILGILKEEHIGTLLAAIAGYVLGRATTKARKAQSEEGRGEAPPVGQLERLKELHSSGDLTDEEFKEAKARLLQ